MQLSRFCVQEATRSAAQSGRAERKTTPPTRCKCCLMPMLFVSCCGTRSWASQLSRHDRAPARSILRHTRLRVRLSFAVRVRFMPRIVKRSTLEAVKSGRSHRGIPLPEFVPPQLSKLVENLPFGPQWLHEIKLDGYRMAARIDNGRAHGKVESSSEGKRSISWASRRGGGFFHRGSVLHLVRPRPF
jgi:hypothetical protein